MASLIRLLKTIYANRSLIAAMGLQQVKSRYLGTFGGLIWSVVHPLMMVLIFWFIFSVGFKVQPQGNVPFIVVFLCGLVPWVSFSESLTANTTAVSGNGHLVTKTLFPTEILPLVNLAASLVGHAIMLILLVIIIVISGIPLSLWNLQFLYYLFALMVFGLGLGWLFSALHVFYRDIGQMISVVVVMWFWVTPIVWPIEMIPDRYHYFIKLNPMFYIVDGYRASFIYPAPFWQSSQETIYFWIVCLLILLLGGSVFKRLKPEFGEVL